MLESGYIKIYRSIVNWEWYSDANTTRLFLHLLLTVNYEPQKWRGITVNRGQRVASYGVLAGELKLSVQNIRTAIKRLISTGEITHKATSEYGLFTVNNYDKFQTLTTQATDEQHTANSRPTHDQQLCNKDNKAKKANKAINTTLPPASGEDALQARDVSALEQRFNEFWNVYPKKTAKQTAFKAYKKAKPSEELHTKILTAVEAAKYSDKWRRDGGQYIPNPATWINGGCWDDEIVTGGSVAYGNNEQGTGFTPKPITQADMPGFHNALDRFDDDGNEIT